MQKENFHKIHKVAVICILLIAILLPKIGQTFPLAADLASQGKTYKVGYFQFDGYHDMDTDGNKSGYGYDFIQMISRYDDNEYEFVGYDKGWNSMFPMLDAGEIDILTNVAKTPEREEQYLYSDYTIGEDGSIFTVRDDNATIVSGDYKTYNNVVVGSIAGSIQVTEFQEFAKEKGFTYVLKTFSTETEMEQALDHGQIDGIISIGLRNLRNEKVMDQVNKSDMYVIVRKDNPELMEQINRAISRLDQESANWRSELFDKYYHADQGDNISFQSDELEYLKQLKQDNTVLKVAVNPDRKPYSYMENGEIQGIIPRIFKEVARRVGLQYEIQETKTRQEYQELLSSGEVDVCLDEIYSFTEAQDSGYKLTDPYLTTSLARVTNNKYDGEVNTIAFVDQADIKSADEKRLLGNVEAVEYSTIEECLEAVKNREVDATYVYAYAAQIAVNEDLSNILRMNILMKYGTEFAVGVPKDRPSQLLTILNKGVNSIEDEYTQNIIADETDYMVEEVPVLTYIKLHPFLITTIALVALLLMIILIFLILRLNYEKRVKEEEEKKNNLLQQKNEQEAEFVQAMTYVCSTNDLVRNTNLIDRTITDYYLEDGKLRTKTKPYVGFDRGNHNLIFYPDDYEKVVERFDEKKVIYLSQHGGGEEYFECRSKNEKGQYRWYGYTMQAIPADDIHPCNYIVYKKDIHEAKLQEEKVRQNLEDALATAQKASEAKGQFMSRMSHEIRTPLNAVLGYLNMARQDQDDPGKVMHCIDNSEIAAKHLLNIINDVLDISAIESGKLKIATTEFSLKNLLRSLGTVFENQAETKQITFSMDMDEVQTDWVVGDSLRLNQVFMNLLSNAMKFTPKQGHVCLSAREVRHTGDKILYQFQVSDDGIGMSKEYQTRLYQSFEQADANIAVKYGGSGLGLSITKNLITMMKGSINVDSKEGQGTTFTVALEFVQSEKSHPESQEVQFCKQRVLVVEDDKEIRDFLKKIIKGYGLKPEFVENLDKAVRKIETRKGSDYSYELCLLDTKIQGFDEKKARKKIPIPVEFLSRPMNPSVLYNAFVKHLKTGELPGSQEEAKKKLSGIHVLLAEDNDMNMEIATDILQKAGIVVHGVRNGKAALDAFCQSSQGEFQAILMDIQMPVMDGYEATRQIRKSSHEESTTIPIIAMTANAFSEDVSAAISAGMNDHISKPVNYDKLYAALEHFIK